MRLVIALSLALGAICLGAPAASAICASADHTVSMTANVGGDIGQTQTWPGGSVTVGDPGCQITINRPSGNISLVGVLGDSWSASIPAGSGIASVSVVSIGAVNCTSPSDRRLHEDERRLRPSLVQLGDLLRDRLDTQHDLPREPEPGARRRGRRLRHRHQ